MEKIKISVELSDIWLKGDYRQLLHAIRDKGFDTCEFEYELWIITTSTSPIWIVALAEQLKVPTERVILCVDETTKIGQIVLNSDIHLDGEQVIIEALSNTSVYPILVDNKLSYDKIGFKYIENLNRWTQVILRKRNGGNIEAESC